LYKIIQENDDFLDTIHTIVVENDYDTIEKKEFVDMFYIKKGFVRTFNFTLDSLEVPNAAEFYSIWTKNFTAPKFID